MIVVTSIDESIIENTPNLKYNERGIRVAKIFRDMYVHCITNAGETVEIRYAIPIPPSSLVVSAPEGFLDSKVHKVAYAYATRVRGMAIDAFPPILLCLSKFTLKQRFGGAGAEKYSDLYFGIIRKILKQAGNTLVTSNSIEPEVLKYNKACTSICERALADADKVMLALLSTDKKDVL